ncbi:hypothetical protein AB1Y20_007352 [Prymnesium parvum]|uniref:Magnesium transporter n=1 Tax=Prymnesium parvum TaxID=97485 RepID=A0AB34IYC5_PRYPA
MLESRAVVSSGGGGSPSSLETPGGQWVDTVGWSSVVEGERWSACIATQHFDDGGISRPPNHISKAQAPQPSHCTKMATAYEVYLGVVLLESSVCLITLGLNIQRLALSKIPPEQRFCGRRLSTQNFVWFGGLMVYFCANIIYTIALVFAPASLCATLASTIILANGICSRFLLHERLYQADWQGGAAITIGIVVAASAAPYNSMTYNAVELSDLFMAPQSLISLGSTFTLLVVLAIGVLAHEGMFKGVSCGFELDADETVRWRKALMPCAYPVVVGLLEALVQIVQKGGATLIVLTLKGDSQLGHITLYVVITTWALLSLLVVWWLRKALNVLEATRCLPIEYGTFTCSSVLLGLLVYDEAKWMSMPNRWTMSAGIMLILAGCAIVGSRQPLRLGRVRASVSQIDPHETPQQGTLSDKLLCSSD